MTPENAKLLATYAGSRRPGGAPGAGVGRDAAPGVGGVLVR